MGDFMLGCLLGQYDKAQSFDVASTANPSWIGSWALGTTAHSRYFSGTAGSSVHSSG